MKTTYAIVLEQAHKNWAAYAPDLPGCISTGATKEECEKNMAEAIEGHIATLKEFGFEVPPPTSEVARIKVAA